MKKTYKTDEKIRERSKAYYWANRDKKIAAAAEYRATNRERLKAYFGRPDVLEMKRIRRRGYVAADPEKYRKRNEEHHLKRYHAITIERYRQMVEAQGGKCAICQQAPNGKAHCKKLHVDHNHATGAIRDLLCAHCNRAIGLFLESPNLMRQAAAYIERHATTGGAA
jgi:hypothetical protein